MIRRRLIGTIIACSAMMLYQSCMKDPQPQRQERKINSKDELILYLDTLEHTYEEACLQMGLANWNSYSKEASYDLDGAKANFAAIFNDTAAAKIIDEWRAKSHSLADKLLARRLELWHRSFTGGAIYADAEIAQLENSLQQRITNFRFVNSESTITRASAANILRQEKRQPARHALWSLTSQLSAQAAADLIRLVKLRSAKARNFGFSNYYSLSLHLNAIREDWLLKTLDDLEEKTREPFGEFIETSKKKFHLRNFGPWDFDYALREAVALPDKYFPPDSVFQTLHAFERGIGFEVDSLPIKEVVKDIPYGGLSLAINIPSDSRFLVNPTKGKGFYSVAFHEYGHSLKSVHTSVDYPILKGYEWIPGAQCGAFEEGVADMHGEFTDDSLWLTTFSRAKPKEIERYIRSRGLPALYRLRNLMKNFAIEYQMYKNPDGNMTEVEHEMFRKYLLVELDEGEPHQFAASIWYTSYPCYYQNYILAAMIATQLQEALSNKFGDEKINDPKVAAWVTEHLYAPGETYEWQERIRNATGKNLEPGAYLRKLGIETSRLITGE